MDAPDPGRVRGVLLAADLPAAVDRAGRASCPLLKALADPVRLRLMSLAASHEGGEACGCDLNLRRLRPGPGGGAQRAWSGRHVQAVHGPEDLTMTQVAGILAEALGRPIRAETTSDDAQRRSLRSAGFGETQVEAIVGMSAVMRPDFVPEDERSIITTTPTAGITCRSSRGSTGSCRPARRSRWRPRSGAAGLPRR
jgi:hypothetical protein